MTEAVGLVVRPNEESSARAGWKLVLALPIASGLLLWASFYLSLLTWFALVPLGLCARLQAGRGRLYLGAYLGGLACFVPGVAWIRLCDPSAWLGWLLLAGYLSAIFPAFLLLTRILNRRWQIPLVWAIPVSWVFLEYVRSAGAWSFGWLLLGHSLHGWIRTIQVAELGGVYAVSFLAATVNAALVEFLTQPLVTPREGRLVLSRPLRWRFWYVMGLVIAGQAFGAVRLSHAPFRDGPRAILIQTNIPQSLKNDEGQAAATLDHVIQLTARIKDDPADLVIWPETSYPYAFGQIEGAVADIELDRLRVVRNGRDPATAKAETGAIIRENLIGGGKDLASITDQLGKPLLAGAIKTVYYKDKLEYYNSSLLFAPEKGLVAEYDKTHLVPFGEYLPFGDTMPFLRRLMPYPPDMDFGLDAANKPKSLHFGGLHFASLICFEDALGGLSRQLQLASPTPIDFLVNQSNDGWFQGSIEAEYHLAASLFRCIEGRVPMARVSNIGTTSLVDGNGRVVQMFRGPGPDGRERTKGVAGHLEVVIPLDDRTGVYLTVGDWLPQWCGLIVAAGLVASLVRHGIRIGQRLQKKSDRPSE